MLIIDHLLPQVVLTSIQVQLLLVWTRNRSYVSSSYSWFGFDDRLGFTLA
jgi:hypothetical protein